MEAKLPQQISRCIAIDLHKHYLFIAGVDREQEVVLVPRRMDFTQWKRWYPANLIETDAVVVESTTNAWHLYDQVEPHVGLAVVANPIKIAMIGKSRVKTDKKDVMWLAKLLAANMMPIVHSPVKGLHWVGSARRRTRVAGAGGPPKVLGAGADADAKSVAQCSPPT